MKEPIQAVILCGGRGKRLSPYTDSIPKPMIDCNNKPFLWYVLDQLSLVGIKEFVILTGYLADVIENYFSDGAKFGWNIKYHRGPEIWDTGRRIWEARHLYHKNFLLMYSDNIVPFPLKKMLKIHKKNNSSITLMVSKKLPGNIEIDANLIAKKYDNNRSNPKLNYVEIGYMIVNKDRTLYHYEKPDCNFSSIIKKMVNLGEISAYIQQDKYHSISDPERWKKTKEYLRNKKIIFIDRDGIINVKAKPGEYIESWAKFIFIEDTLTALKDLSEKGFKFIVISNQAGINRGMISLNNVNTIHKNLINELKSKGIEILDIFFCPHHWDEGCSCRKPKAGMFIDASTKWNIRLDKSVFIGDDIRDCEAAYNAGSASIFIGNSIELDTLMKNGISLPLIVSNKLTDCVDEIQNFYAKQ